MLVTGNNITGQTEKKLEANVFVNRRNIVMNTALRTSISGGDRGVLLGQDARAGLSITPRIFGFCGGSHQQAAVQALESIWDVRIPPNAILLRSVAQATEILQNIPRWFYTTFAPDLTNTKFANQALYNEVCERFTKFKGTSFKKGLTASVYPISLYSLMAGQWPHADFIIPGGVATTLEVKDLAKAFVLLEDFRTNWLESTWLGCSVDRYLEIQSWDDLMIWLNESESHRNSDLGLFLRASLDYGLDELGDSKNQFMAYGLFPDKQYAQAQNYAKRLIPSGYFDAKGYATLNWEGIQHQLDESGLQQVNCEGKAIEVGPLSRMIMAGASAMNKMIDPLFKSLYEEKGANVLTRSLARMHEASRLFHQIQHALTELDLKEVFANPVAWQPDGTGLGLTEAPRGALAHFVEVEQNKIKRYEILAPTVLNVESGLQNDKNSPIGAALQGVEIQDLENPIELGMIARSFDACLVCEINIFKHKSEKELAKVQL